VSTTEELLGRKSSGSGLEIREYGRRESVTLTMWFPLSAKKLGPSSPTSGGRSVGIFALGLRPRSLVIYVYMKKGIEQLREREGKGKKIEKENNNKS
jgi:hypothetical protein